MGTRNMTFVVKDGENKVAQYGQWDGYPEGQGNTVVEFLTSKEYKRKDFEDNLTKCKVVTEEWIQNEYKKLGADGTGWVTCDISDAFRKKYPTLHRDTAAGVLALIQKKPQKLWLDDFDREGFFGIEWSYLINLDKKVLEVYRGLASGEPYRVFSTTNKRTLRKEWNAFIKERKERD